ncbi:hypothetical protein G6O67_004751 [Ophiocordyceps sinensis]|uniref:Uncharacterized protein n=1 Tax=Ophiocordyceps sinensis TaxID=72228 RepID=A0A8H4PQ29_9HYPO|nr:hypothetical protein G6O67_004751 [Ophiocordyceps sinensis]
MLPSLAVTVPTKETSSAKTLMVSVARGRQRKRQRRTRTPASRKDRRRLTRQVVLQLEPIAVAIAAVRVTQGAEGDGVTGAEDAELRPRLDGFTTAPTDGQRIQDDTG